MACAKCFRFGPIDLYGVVVLSIRNLHLQAAYIAASKTLAFTVHLTFRDLAEQP